MTPISKIMELMYNILALDSIDFVSDLADVLIFVRQLTYAGTSGITSSRTDY